MKFTQMKYINYSGTSNAPLMHTEKQETISGDEKDTHIFFFHIENVMKRVGSNKSKQLTPGLENIFLNSKNYKVTKMLLVKQDEKIISFFAD